MNEHPDNDPIEALLGEEPGYIEDQGFSARVVAALPARRPLAWLRPVLILGATVLSLALMVWWLAEGGAPALAPSMLAASTPEVLAVCVIGGSLVASIVCGVVAALRWE